MVGIDFRLNIHLWKSSLCFSCSAKTFKAQRVFCVLFGAVYYLFRLFLHVRELLSLLLGVLCFVWFGLIVL